MSQVMLPSESIKACPWNSRMKRIRAASFLKFSWAQLCLSALAALYVIIRWVILCLQAIDAKSTFAHGYMNMNWPTAEIFFLENKKASRSAHDIRRWTAQRQLVSARAATAWRRVCECRAATWYGNKTISFDDPHSLGRSRCRCRATRRESHNRSLRSIVSAGGFDQKVRSVKWKNKDRVVGPRSVTQAWYQHLKMFTTEVHPARSY